MNECEKQNQQAPQAKPAEPERSITIGGGAVFAGILTVALGVILAHACEAVFASIMAAAIAD